MDIERDLEEFLKSEILEDASIEINPRTELFASGILTSLDLMRTIRFIERTFGLTVPFDGITPENFMSIGSMASYINTLKKQP